MDSTMQQLALAGAAGIEQTKKSYIFFFYRIERHAPQLNKNKDNYF